MRTALLLILAAFALGAEKPLLTVSVSDLAASRARWPTTLYGSAVMSPGLAGLREWVAQRSARLGPPRGIDPLALFNALDGADLALLPSPDGRDEPGFVVHLRGAAVADLVLAGAKLPEAGADPIGKRPAQRRTAQGLLIGRRVAALAAPAVEACPPGVDLLATWDGARLIAAVTQGLGTSPDDQALREILGGFASDGRLEVTLTPEGVRERCLLPQRPAGLAPIDTTLLARLPADAITVYAVGLDGEAFWKAHGAAVFVIAGLVSRTDATRVRQTCDEGLAKLGVQGGCQALATGLRGTAIIALGRPQGLLPGLIVALPRSQSLDALVAGLLGLSATPLPEEDRLAFIALPRLRGMDHPVMAGGIALARDRSHWWLTTDPVQLSDILAGRAKGWDAAPLGRRALAMAGRQPCLVGGNQSRDLLAGLLPFIAIGASQFEGNRFGPALTQAAHDLVLRCGNDVVVARPDDGPTGGSLIEAEGPLGGVFLPLTGGAPVLATLLVPAITKAREEARRTQVANNLRMLVTMFVDYREMQGRPPKDLAELIAAYPDEHLEKFLVHPYAERAPAPNILYLHYKGIPGANTVVMIDNPACWNGQGSVAGFGDGHTEFVRGDAHWRVAQALAERAATAPLQPPDWFKAFEEAEGRAPAGAPGF